MRNYGVPNRSHPQCAFIDEGQVEIKRREGKRGKRGEREEGQEMEKIHPETFIYFTFKSCYCLKHLWYIFKIGTIWTDLLTTFDTADYGILFKKLGITWTDLLTASDTVDQGILLKMLG